MTAAIIGTNTGYQAHFGAELYILLFTKVKSEQGLDIFKEMI